MKKKLYEIKPLEWSGSIEKEGDSLMSNTRFGTYYVKMRLEPSEWDSIYYAEYCFDEYYDEGHFDVSSVDEGKQKCWEHWIERITSDLHEVPNPDRWIPAKDEFVNLVKRMREAQRNYFKTSRNDYLLEAMRLEAAVDSKIAEMEATKLPEQKTLF